MMTSDNKGPSLFLRVLIAFLAVVIVVSGAMTWAFYVFSWRSIEQHTSENILQQFRAIEYHFGFESREALVKDLRVLASNPVLDEFIMSSPLEREIVARALEQLFLGGMRYHENYDSMYFVDALGREQVKVDRSGRIRTYRTMRNAMLFTRIKAAAPGGVVLDRAGKDSAGRIIATIGIHKVDHDIGKFGGAIIIDWDLHGFLDYLGGIKIFNENLIWLFSQDGTLLKQPGTTGEALDPRPYLSMDFQNTPRMSLMKEGMVVYQDLSVLPGEPFVRLAIGVPSSLLLKDVRATLRLILLVFLLAVIVTSIITYYVSHYLARPISALARAADRLARGDLSTRVTVRSSGEVQRLIDSFNRMAGDIEKTTVSKNYVNDVIASMRDTLIVTSSDGTILRINMAASFLLGYADTELIGQPLSRVIPDEPGAKQSVVEAVHEHSSISSVEKSYLTRNRKRIPMLF
jgi:PAS domain S-box-containing protein